MNKREVKRLIKQAIQSGGSVTVDSDGDAIEQFYLGSFFALDPCGRYHHALSPNGATNACERFWERLELVAGELDGWTEAGEGNATDIYFCRVNTSIRQVECEDCGTICDVEDMADGVCKNCTIWAE